MGKRAEQKLAEEGRKLSLRELKLDPGLIDDLRKRAEAERLEAERSRRQVWAALAAGGFWLYSAVVTACGTSGAYTIHGEKYRDSALRAGGNCPSGDNVLRATGLSTGIRDPQTSLDVARARARANMMQMIATQIQNYLNQTTDNLTGANPFKAANGQETKHFMQTLASGLVADSCVARVYTAESGDTFVRITMRWGADQDKYLKSFSDPAMQNFSTFINQNADMLFHNVKQVDKIR